MKRYTIGQACDLLNIPRSTLKRHCKKLKISPKNGDLDARESYLSEADVERLRSAYESLHNRNRIATEKPLHSRSIVEDLTKKVAELQAENELLKKRLESRLDVLLSQDGSLEYDMERLRSATQSQRNRNVSQHRVSQYPELPPGWTSLDGFCAEQCIPHTTVRQAIERGELPEPHHPAPGELPWRRGRGLVRNALDLDMQSRIILRYGKVAPDVLDQDYESVTNYDS